jgi:Fe-S-cluster containining protein
LKIDSNEFINRYAVIPFNKQQKIPVAILKLNDDKEKTCQFVGKDGCTVYEDRPWACRMYPVGMASPEDKKYSVKEEFYFLMQEEVCKGLNEKREITVQEWIQEQGIEEYNKIGELFKEITMHPALLDGLELEPNQIEMYYLVNYNIDKFRRFVFESSFLEKFDVEASTVEKIEKDDVELLKFGYKWLRFTLFGEKTMTIRDEVVRKKMSDLKKSKAK